MQTIEYAALTADTAADDLRATVQELELLAPNAHAIVDTLDGPRKVVEYDEPLTVATVMRELTARAEQIDSEWTENNEA